MLSKRLN